MIRPVETVATYRSDTLTIQSFVKFLINCVVSIWKLT